MSLLKQDTSKKEWVDEKVKQMEFDNSNNDSREYKVKAIWDGAVYAKDSKSGHLPGL